MHGGKKSEVQWELVVQWGSVRVSCSMSTDRYIIDSEFKPRSADIGFYWNWYGSEKVNAHIRLM